MIASSPTSIDVMRGSLLAAVLIPCLQDVFEIVSNQFSNSVQFFGRESIIAAELNRLQPEFAKIAFSPHVDVLRLCAIEAVEEEPIWARDSTYRRHERNRPPNPIGR